MENAMQLKTTGQCAHIKSLAATGHRDPCLINVPASGFASALGVKIVAYAAKQYIQATAPTVSYRKRRHFNPLDAFVGEHSALDVWPTAHSGAH